MRSVRSLLRKVATALRTALSLQDIKYNVLKFLFIVDIFKKNLKKFYSLLRSREVDVIILPEDVVGPVTPLYVKAGHELGIPTLILPYTVANQEEAFQGLRSQPSYQLAHPGNRLMTLLSSKWRMSRDGVSLVRMPAPYILGHSLTRTTPPDPWLMNSGFANCIAVENEAMKAYYLKAGIKAAKLRVVGAVYDDQLANYRAANEKELPRVLRELNLTTDKPLLLIGGCPNQLASIVPACDFADMESIARFVMKSIQPLQDVYQVVVRPHPNYPEFGPLCESFGAKSTMIDTARLVALSSLYIAFASATLRWAIACCVPCINYDVFHYDYKEFAAVRGVFNVSEQEAFRNAIQALRPGSVAYEEARLALEANEGYWGLLDGKSADRISELIKELSTLKPVPRTAG